MGSPASHRDGDKAGLIDEIGVLIQQAIDGLAGVQSNFDCHGEADERSAARQALRHFHTETLERGMVRLRYRVEKAPKAQKRVPDEPRSSLEAPPLARMEP